MLSRLLGSVALVASVLAIGVPVCFVIAVAVVIVTVVFTATIREDRNFKRAFEAVSERHVDGMVGDRRRQREREAGRDRVARPLDGAVVVVTLTIVIAAAVLAPAGVYRAAAAASLGCCKPARLIQLHNVCGAVFAESHIDDRCPRPLLRTTALWAEVDAVVGNLDLCALVVICTATDMSCVRLNPPYSREAGRSGKAGQFPRIDRSVQANSNRRGDGISRERIGQTTNVGRARRTSRGVLYRLRRYLVLRQNSHPIDIPVLIHDQDVVAACVGHQYLVLAQLRQMVRVRVNTGAVRVVVSLEFAQVSDRADIAVLDPVEPGRSRGRRGSLLAPTTRQGPVFTPSDLDHITSVRKRRDQRCVPAVWVQLGRPGARISNEQLTVLAHVQPK